MKAEGLEELGRCSCSRGEGRRQGRLGVEEAAAGHGTRLRGRPQRRTEGVEAGATPFLSPLLRPTQVEESCGGARVWREAEMGAVGRWRMWMA